MNEIAKKLAKDHAGYIEQLLEVHGETKDNIIKVGFHYQTAFIHGFKHGVEWAKEQKEEIDPDAFKWSGNSGEK